MATRSPASKPITAVCLSEIFRKTQQVLETKRHVLHCALSRQGDTGKMATMTVLVAKSHHPIRRRNPPMPSQHYPDLIQANTLARAHAPLTLPERAQI